MIKQKKNYSKKKISDNVNRKNYLKKLITLTNDLPLQKANKMNNKGKVTSLSFSMSSGENEDKKHFSKKYFNFKGNISFNEAKTLVNNFKEIVSKLEENIPMNEINDDETITSTSASEEDELPELHNLPDPISDDNIIVQRTEPNEQEPEQKENEVLNTRYPVHGNAMSLSHIGYNKNVIQTAWDNHASVLIESFAPKNMNGHRLSYYRVVFPPAGGPFQQLTCTTEDIPVFLQNHGYPVCSCPAYYFKSYKFSQNYGYLVVTGMCKHIGEALGALGINASLINWQVRPNELPLILKEEGVEEYQWIPLNPI